MQLMSLSSYDWTGLRIPYSFAEWWVNITVETQEANLQEKKTDAAKLENNTEKKKEIINREGKQ